MEHQSESLIDERREDIRRLKEAGVVLHPERFEVSYPNISDIPRELGRPLRVAGRITAIRSFGKLAFVRLYDVTGDIQAALSVNHLGRDLFKLLVKTCKVGDYLGVAGETFLTRTEEFTVQAEEAVFLGIALRPLPEKWHGLKDVETRYRRRYLDLVANPESRSVMLARIKLIAAMRRVFEDSGFFEIETPVLNTVQTGALAKPFTTHHNALDIDLFLRIAPETYLKRATAAGLNRTFEFAKCFRNEGISADYLQEFTMLEFYVAYWNFEDNMAFTQRLLQESLQATFGTLEFGQDTDSPLDFSGQWPVVDFRQVILDACGIDIQIEIGFPQLLKAAKAARIEIDDDDAVSGNWARLADAVYKRTARPQLAGPLFLTGHPVQLSPLARQNDDDQRIVDRFQLLVGGVELINGYSELVDAEEQRRRLSRQASLKSEGDDEAMDLDEDYLLCMEHGMPPISGTGIGIDRLLKTALNLPNLKDAVLFPLLRKER